MELYPSYTFIPLKTRNFAEFGDKRVQEYLEKWGLKGNIIIQDFSFNENFHPYHKYHIAEAFFKDEAVSKKLLIKQNMHWVEQDFLATNVDFNPVPCTVLNMSFFDKLKNPENNIIYKSGTIRKRYDLDIDGFIVSDNLKGMLLDKECNEYFLYSTEERKEFIFRIFQLLVLGGQLCQYEDTLEPYLDVTKTIYKDLIKVQKCNDSNDFTIGTIILEVIARDNKGLPYYPNDTNNKQNIAFLLIDGNSNRITTLIHEFGGYPYDHLYD